MEETDWHQLAEDRFAVEIAATLYRRVHAGHCEKLVIVAPPKVLGEMRKAFHKEVSACISAEIPKELTSHPLPEIEKILAADTRAELTTACRAFDRVFRAGRYWVPHWYRATHPLAYWDIFDHPKTLPRYQIDNYATNVGERILWWCDPAKAAKLEQAK